MNNNLHKIFGFPVTLVDGLPLGEVKFGPAFTFCEGVIDVFDVTFPWPNAYNPEPGSGLEINSEPYKVIGVEVDVDSKRQKITVKKVIPSPF